MPAAEGCNQQVVPRDGCARYRLVPAIAAVGNLVRGRVRVRVRVKARVRVRVRG